MRRPTRRALGLTGLAIAATLALSGCGATPDSADGGETSGEIKVGYLMYNLGLDPFMSAFQVALEESAAEHGVALTVGDGQEDISVMNGIMDQFIVNGMDAIVIAPPDPESLVSASLKAQQAGIPVFSAVFATSEDAQVSSHIAPDDVELGRIQGEIVAEALGGTGNIALQTGSLGSNIEIERTRGFKEAIKEFPGLVIIEEQPNNWQSDTSLALTQNWLSKYGEGKIDAIVAQGPDLVGGAEWAASQGRDDVIFVGLDYSHDVRSAIMAGTVYATVNQDPAITAQRTMETILAKLAGEEVDTRVVIDAQIINASNAEATPAAF